MFHVRIDLSSKILIHTCIRNIYKIIRFFIQGCQSFFFFFLNSSTIYFYLCLFFPCLCLFYLILEWFFRIHTNTNLDHLMNVTKSHILCSLFALLKRRWKEEKGLQNKKGRTHMVSRLSYTVEDRTERNGVNYCSKEKKSRREREV